MDSLRKSSTYLCCDTNIRTFDQATSIPRKYLSFPGSFISNSLANWYQVFNKQCVIYLTLFILHLQHYFSKSPEPRSWRLLQPIQSFFSTCKLYSCQIIWSKQDGDFIYPSSSTSPCKNAFFTSTCCKYQSKLAAKDKSTC